MNFTGYYQHPENPQVTKAFDLAKKGKHVEAVSILAAERYTDAEHQVQLIEGFIRHMATFQMTERKLTNGQPIYNRRTNRRSEVYSR
jgi:hypothetical protein